MKFINKILENNDSLKSKNFFLFAVMFVTCVVSLSLVLTSYAENLAAWLVLLGLVTLSLFLVFKLILHDKSRLVLSSDFICALFEATPDAILLVSKDGLVVNANSHASELFACQHDQLIGATVESLIPERFRVTHQKLRDEAFKHTDNRDFMSSGKFFAQTTNGEEVPLDISLSYFNHEGQSLAIVTLKDISRLDKTERELAASRSMFAKAQKITHLGSWHWDIHSDNLLWSDEAYHIFGAASDAFESNYDAFLTLLHPDDKERVVNAMNATVVYDKPYSIEHRIIRPSGEIRYVHQQGDVFREEGGIADYMVGTIFDITERKSAERELKLADTVFSHTVEAIVVADAEGHILRVNDAFTNITQYSSNEAMERKTCDLFNLCDDDDTLGKINKSLQESNYWAGEAKNQRKNGEQYIGFHNITSVKNNQGEIIQLINIFSDVTQKKQAEQYIHDLAHYDQLTGLPNRTSFTNSLQALLSEMSGEQQLGLMFIDLDGFKGVNDTMGHDAGDYMLKEISGRLVSIVGSVGKVCRLGGDEFTVMVENAQQEHCDLSQLASDILRVLGQPIHIAPDDVFIGGSVGISVYPVDGRTPEALIKNADMAMYEAKKRGRNRYVFYSEQFARATQRRFSMENKLRQAQEKQELELFYQPLIDWGSGRLVGAEALLRWRDEAGQLIMPDELIPLAEQTGLIEPIGNWVIFEACRQTQEWLAFAQPDFRITVNVSGRQITHGSIVDVVQSVLKETRLTPEHLELEITEDFVMEHPQSGISTLKSLRDLGVSLAIDDFGTGYSSLSYLKQLSVDRLKIDRSFVMDIPQDKDDEAITATIIAMAKNLGLSVIAEGVETSEHIRFLSDLNCSEMQGFYFSKPLPKDEFEVLLQSKHWLPSMKQREQGGKKTLPKITHPA